MGSSCAWPVALARPTALRPVHRAWDPSPNTRESGCLHAQTWPSRGTYEIGMGMQCGQPSHRDSVLY